MSTAIFPETWNSVQIGVIAKVVMGQAPSGESYNTDESGVPLIAGASDLADTFPHPLRWTTSPTQMCQPGDLIFCVRATIGEMNWADKEYCLGRGVAALQPERTLIEPDYLYYWLLANKESFIKLASGSTFVQIRRQDIESFAIPLPPLPEQRRIAAILRQADGLRRLRREADEKAQQLVPAIFYKMFGDPISNPRNWETAPLHTVGQLDRGKSQHRPRDASHLYGGPYPFIQTGDIANSNGTIVHYAQTYSEAGLRQSRLWPKGTLCITIAANIAKTAILTFDACFPDSVVGFIPGPAVTAEYVREWFVANQSILESLAPQAAQKNINLQILKNLLIPLPPLNLQQAFSQRVLEINRLFELQDNYNEYLDTLFQSLLAQAFSGELTAAWREEHKGLESIQALPVLPQQVEEEAVITEENVIEQSAVMLRADLIKVLSQEQRSVLDAVNSNNGYCTVEMLQDTSGIPPYIIRQGLQLLIRLGLVQVVQLPDRPVRDIVYTPAYRALADVDRVRERDLAILNEEVEKRMML